MFCPFQGEQLNGLLYNVFINESHDINDFVKLHPSSIWNDDKTIHNNNASNLLRFDINDKYYRWHSAGDIKYPYIIFEFTRNFIFITNYSFALLDDKYPVSWIVQGSSSIHSKSWKTISTVNGFSLDPLKTIVTFPTTNGLFKAIKFRMIKNNINDVEGYKHVFALKKVEFFGYFGNNEKFVECYI